MTPVVLFVECMGRNQHVEKTIGVFWESGFFGSVFMNI